jgi:hypothetical protein
MKEMYEADLYAEKNPTWHEEDSPWKASHVERMIKRNNLPHQRICEVGCGTVRSGNAERDAEYKILFKGFLSCSATIKAGFPNSGWNG